MFEPDNPSPRPPVETAFSARRRRLQFPLVLAAAFISAMLTDPVVLANPTGGVVVRGKADIKTYPERVTVQQHSDKTVINWNGFSIEGGEVTRFRQPGKNSIALNRVITNQPSHIHGLLKANGNVWLVNQNGITIGPDGEIQAQGFLATTSDIADSDFMDGGGPYNFRPSTNHNPNARVVNQGRISVGERGLGALVAPHARNDHLIQGKGSTVVIGGAKTFAVDFYGDGLIHFETGSPVTQRPEDVDALVENNGMILVEGGQVLLTADAAAGILDNVIKVGGKVQARSAYSDGGEIVLDGGRSGTVAVTGTLDASSKHPRGHGGKIDVRGHRIELGPKALVQASGNAGGGSIRIGGDPHGKGPGRNADAVVLAPEARIIADATVAGDGGSIIVYGKETAVIDGILTARGGPKGGDGGFIETSAAGTIEIAADVLVNASAPAGEPGLWLIDPRDITIGAPDTPGTTLANTTLVSALEAGNNVEVNTSQAPYGNAADPGAGNITVAADIRPDLTQPVYPSSPQNVTLTLTADNDVTINSGVTIGPMNADTGDSMGVTITVGNDITNNGTIDVSAGAEGDVNLTTGSNIALGRINAGAGNITATAGGTVTVTQAVTAAGKGAILLRTTGSTGNALQVNNAVTATSDLTLDAAGRLSIAAAVSGSNVDLSSGTDILHTSDGDVTSTGTLTVSSKSNLSMADGTLYRAGGRVSLTSSGGDVSLGRIEAGTNPIVITANAINGTFGGRGDEHLVGGDLTLTAGCCHIGTPGVDVIRTAVDKIDATTAGNGFSRIVITETDAVQLGNTAPITAGTTGGGYIEVTAGGTMTVAKDVTTTGRGGYIQLRTTGDLLINKAVMAGGDLTLDAAGRLNIAAAVSGSRADLTGGTGITHTAAGDVTSTSTITATPKTGDIIMADGTVYSAAGDVNLTAAGNVQLGRIQAGTNPITVTATTGSISDNTAAEDAGSENLVGSAISLTAGSGIGAAGDAAIDTAASVSIDAQTTNGSIAIAETNAVQLGGMVSPGIVSVEVTPGPGGSIQVSGSAMTVAQAVTTAGSGDIRLRTTSGDLQVNQAVTAAGDLELDAAGQLLTSDRSGGLSVNDGGVLSAGGDVSLAARGGDMPLSRINAGTNAITLTAGGAITDVNPNVKENGLEEENLIGGFIHLTATGGAIGATGDGDIDMAATSLDGQTTSGDIYIDETDDIALGRIDAGTNAIALKAGGAITDQDLVAEGANNENLVGGNISLIAGGTIGATGAADIDIATTSLDAQTTAGDIFIEETDNLTLSRVDAGAGNITITAGGAITDGTSDEGTGKENLVGGAITLRAAGIGALGDAEDIDIAAATSIDATATGSGGDVSIANTSSSGVQLGGTGTTQVTPGAGGSIQVTADNGPMTVLSDTSTTENGEIHLQATDSDLTINTDVTIESENGKIRLATGSGTLTLEDVGDSSPTHSVIRTGNADIELAVNDLTIQNNDPTGTAQIVAGGGKDIVFLPTGSRTRNGQTIGPSIGLGGAAGEFRLDDSEIAALETTGLVRFGADAERVGEVRIDTADFGAVGGLELFSNGSISDVGTQNESAPNQLQAKILRLDASTGIGDNSNPLNTAINSLDAQTTSGGIYIDETDDIALGRVDAGTNAIILTAGGAITDKDPVAEGAGNENLVGGSISLIAAGAIGDAAAGAPIETEADSLDAQTTNGSIFIDEIDSIALGRVVADGGDITLRAGGAITDKDPAAEGANNENLVGGNISLIAGGAIGATGAADIDIAATSLDAQTTAGDIFIEETDDIALGRVVAGTDSGRKDITITAGGAISDADTTPGGEGAGKENLVGGAIRLTAGSDIGAAGDAAIDTAASVSINAQTTGGSIAIAETNAVRLGGTAPPGVVRVAVTPGPDGSIQVSGSAMTVAQALTTAGSGNIRLRTTTGNLQVDQAITAGGELNLEAADLLSLAAAVSGGGNVTLTGGTGIGHTAAGDVTAGGTLNATATSGDIGMAEGTLYSAGGAVTLTAQRDVQLGRIEAGTNPITITAVTGAITDNTVAEGGAGNENLVGGAVTLRAGTGIGFGTPRDADIDVVMNGVIVEASEVDAQTTSGGIFINVSDEITPPESEIPEPEPETPEPEPETPEPEPEVPEPEPEIPEPEPETPEPEPEIPESNIPDGPPGSEEIEIPDKGTEPEKIPNETIETQAIRSLEAIDSTSSSVDGLFDSPADVQVLPEYDGVLPDYGVPDYGADEEPDLVHLSGANESLWENQGKPDDEPEVSEDEGSEEEESEEE